MDVWQQINAREKIDPRRGQVPKRSNRYLLWIWTAKTEKIEMN